VYASSSDWFSSFSSITYVTTITITARIVVVVIDDIIKEKRKEEEEEEEEKRTMKTFSQLTHCYFLHSNSLQS
jgi:hypothetical protein